MKKLLYVLAICSLIIGCSKEDTPEYTPENCLDEICIDGEWEWVASNGSIAGVTITPESENETRKLIISGTSYKEFVNDELILEVGYEFVKSNELSTFTNDSLVLKLANDNWFAVLERDGNLVLRQPCFDCWDHTYQPR